MVVVFESGCVRIRMSVRENWTNVSTIVLRLFPLQVYLYFVAAKTVKGGVCKTESAREFV